MRKVARPALSNAREQGFHNIGEAADRSGISSKMIRNYERMGLIPPAGRTFAGYRIYSDVDLERFRFIRRARALGLPTKQIRPLLELRDDQLRSSTDVQRLVQAHAIALSTRIRELGVMQQLLATLIARCQGIEGPNCPILDDLATHPGASIVDWQWRK